MELVYLTDAQIPSRATNATQTMRMCAAFSAQGVNVTLVHPYRFGNRPEGLTSDLWSFYGVAPTFRRIALPTFLTLRLSRARSLARVARGLPLSSYLVTRTRPGSAPFVFYSRSMLGAWLAISARTLWGRASSCRGVFLELHDSPSTSRSWDLIEGVDGLVAISSALRDHVAARSRVSDRIIVAHDGVDSSLLSRPDPSTRAQMRMRLGYDESVTVVGYTGRVNVDKGVPTILDAARRLNEARIRFLLVGKEYDGLPARISQIPTVTSIGFVPPSKVSQWVAAMDILVLPTSGRIPYARYTSPLKLFEYMASGLPVLCSNLPVLQEVVLHRSNALLFQTDNGASLASVIRELAADPPLATTLGKRAHIDAANYTWERRAERIIGFIRTLLETSVSSADHRHAIDVRMPERPWQRTVSS